ncbi:MAG: HDIG domain-containing protein [Muribaculaceae bacterium]|nr:HDIG domain-containing protein [Muribaculaceae bacterium]
MKLPVQKIIARSIYFIISVVTVLLLLPGKTQQQFTYVENRPWNHSLLTAPFDIPVFRDSVTVRILTDSIRENFIPIYRKDSEIGSASIRKLPNVEERDGLDFSRLRAVIDRLYANGIVDNATSSQITQGELPQIRIISDNEVRTVSTHLMRSQRDAYIIIDSLFSSPVQREELRKIDISSLLLPNILPDAAENEKFLQEALQPATVAIGVIQKGERIIDRGDIVNPQLYQVLQTYEEMMQARELTDTTEEFYIDLGAVLFAALLFGSVYGYFFLYRREWWQDDRRILCVLALLLGSYILAVIFSQMFRGGLFLIPFTIISVLVMVFYDARTSLFMFMVSILLAVNLSNFPLEFIFVEFMAGITAIFSMKELSKRSDLLRTAFYVLIAYAVSYVAIELMTTGTFNVFSWRLMGFFLINAVLISFAYIMIFIVEKVFGFTSMVTLVELSDINNPILQELSEECPGTFQHSMAVSNLAADAARKLGANVQLVRTGALYHDIGKLANPAFFTENQHGVNPHDALTPEQSAKIIIDHINEGLKRADKAKLPEVIKDMISQHHGAGKAKYFYITECKKMGEENVDASKYTYPGPNPKTLEASLIMMADAVEAASRSLSEHTPEETTQLVNRLIDSQIADGLHADSPLSFRDVSLIKQTFINRLLTMYHSRIAYPTEIKRAAVMEERAISPSDKKDSN